MIRTGIFAKEFAHEEKAVHKTITALATVMLLMAALSGCGRSQNTAKPSEPVLTAAPVSTEAPVNSAAPVSTAAPSEAPAPAAEPGRQDGERFEATIILEGIEEAVQYEHIRNDAIGIEMDYDYERFVRQGGLDRERFVSIWDDPQKPENYLDVTYSAEDADTAAASVREALSREYDLLESTRELERAGSCLRIEASEIKGTGMMPDQIQAVYIIPAPDGCRIATAHCYTVESEGFLRRFNYMLNTLAVIDRSGETGLSDEQALAAIRNYCYVSNPDLESIVNAGEVPVYWEIASSDASEIVVLFRSYTGAQIRYYIDRISGDTYVTEFVPGITSEEMRTDESFNVRDY